MHIRCLTNIATGDHAETGAVLCAVPNMVEILNSNNTPGSVGRDTVELQEQICWALGNVAGDCEEHRAVLVGNGGLAAVFHFLEARVTALLEAINSSSAVPGVELPATLCSAAHTAAWTLSNLARGKVSARSFVNSGTSLRL